MAWHDDAPLTKAAFGPPGASGPRPMEAEWGELTARREHDVVVYWGGAWNRLGTHLGWGWLTVRQQGKNDDGGHVHPAVRTAAAKIERLLSPLANESRIHIMQLLHDGPMSAAEISEAIGLRGGGLYYHLKELLHAAYVCERDGAYDLTPLGCIMLVNVACAAEYSVKDQDLEGLVITSQWGEGSPTAKES